MCRSTHFQSNSHGHGDGDGDIRDPFTITVTAFFVRLCGSRFQFNAAYESSASKPNSLLPDSLILLLYLPLNSSNNNTLEIDGSTNKIPPYSHATLSLRQLQLANEDVIFGSKQRVRATTTTQVLSFQIYVGEAKLLKGTIRKENHHHHNWKLECCKCELLNPNSFSIPEVELWVALDGHVAIRERVAILTPNNNNKKPIMPIALVRKNKDRTNKLKLEEIPEETELRIDTDIDAAAAYANPELEEALEMDLEVLRRALDMGIWVLCAGLGYMFSRVNFRRPPTFS